MRIAIPLSAGQLSQHFGHSEQFLFIDVEPEKKSVAARQVEKAPEHVPGLLPKWLKERGVNLVITGGIGAHALELLTAASVQVLAGVSTANPDVIVDNFLNGKLETGIVSCNHSGTSCQH